MKKRSRWVIITITIIRMITTKMKVFCQRECFHHQLGHSSDTNENGIVMLKNIYDFINTEIFVGIRINLQNRFCKLIPFLRL